MGNLCLLVVVRSQETRRTLTISWLESSVERDLLPFSCCWQVSPGRGGALLVRNRHTFPTLGKAWESKPKHCDLVFLPPNKIILNPNTLRSPPFQKRARSNTGAGRGETQAPNSKHKGGFMVCSLIPQNKQTHTQNTHLQIQNQHGLSLDQNTETRHKPTNNTHMFDPSSVSRFRINWNAVRCVSKSSHKRTQTNKTNKTNDDRQTKGICNKLKLLSEKPRAGRNTHKQTNKQTKPPAGSEKSNDHH
jgi:hypothetical protein